MPQGRPLLLADNVGEEPRRARGRLDLAQAQTVHCIREALVDRDTLLGRVRCGRRGVPLAAQLGALQVVVGDHVEDLAVAVLEENRDGSLSVAIDDLANRDPARRAVASIEELIEDLREATSLEDALEKGERVELDLVGLVRETACAYRDANHAALEIDLPDQSFRTVVIERRIEQLLEKLLDNAVDFSDENPVRISVECAEDEARILVENTGSQLPEGPAAEQLFAPMRSDRKRTSERHLGLGLYVARVIAEQHGGSIRAWNADGGRVVFEVTIRRAD